LKKRRQKGYGLAVNKYSRGHKGVEKKFFYIEGSSEKEHDEEEILELGNALGKESKYPQPIISYHVLLGFSTPQTLKVVGFLKKERVTVDLWSTHNLDDKKLTTHLNYFIYPALEFQVLIANGGTISCSRKLHSIKLSLRDYHLDCSMLSISMGTTNIVLGVQWLTTLGMIEMNF